MIILLAILILLLTPLVMVGLRLIRPGFSYYWLLAVGGAFLAWILVLLASLRLPLSIPILDWQAQAIVSATTGAPITQLFRAWPTLLVDGVSWPFSISLATLLVATILTEVVHRDVAESPPSSWRALSGYMLLIASGLLAVLAGNPLTLLFAWVIVDLVELTLWLGEARSARQSESLVIAFSTRLIGTLVAVWAVIVAGIPLSAQASDPSWAFAALAPRVNVYLLIAAGIRLGIPPFNSQYRPEMANRRGKLTLLNLALPAATLPVVVRVALAPQPLFYNEILLLWIGLAALLSSLSWITSADEAKARHHWAPGIAALALACGIRGEATASLAWGVSLLLSGGVIFLYSIRRRWLLPLPVLGAVGISVLPFTPTWSAVRLSTTPIQITSFQPLSLVFIASQALILGGYLYYGLRTTTPPTKAERWIWVIYPLGLAILPLVQWGIFWWSRSSPLGISQAAPSWVESWPGFIIAGLSTLYAIWRLRGHQEPIRLGSALNNLIELEWLYRPLWRVYEILSRIFALFNRVLEGRAGILWALLILILLVSVFAQARPGG